MSDETVFAAALEKADPTERAAFLDAACPDPAARERVERLLAAHAHAGAFMRRPAAAPETFPTVTQAAGGGDPDDALALLAPSARPDALGRIGHYDVLQVLGKGAFGIVFRAFDDVLQRVVAVKVMAPPLAATSPARKRFLREARSSAQVRHENVVQVYEVAEQPLPYIVMEFIPGETLQQRLDRTGPVDAAEVVRVGRQIAEGLAAAHASDLIHRDIKPGNVLIEGGQHRVKITDFGLARAADDASISQSGIIAGTPMYMAPEQAKGETLDHRADLFSLGSVLYQMAAGRPPFRANNTVAVLKRVAEDTPRDIREVIPETPAWLCAVVAKLHAKNPADRYQTAREVADVLADCEAQLKADSKLKDFSHIPALPAAPRARRWGWAAALAAVVLLVLAGLWAGPPLVDYARNRGELEILPGDGLSGVIVLRNDDGVIDGNKLHAPATDWLDVTEPRRVPLPPGQYQLNVGTWPAGTEVTQWEVTSSGLFGSSRVTVPVVRTSAVVTVDRGHRVTLRPVMRRAPPALAAPAAAPAAPPPAPAVAPFTPEQAKAHQEAWAKHLGVPVETAAELKGKDQDKPTRMTFRLIPPGEFLMGAGPGDDLAGRAERPPHPVRLTRPFYLGVHEVTVRQFRAFAGEKENRTYETLAEVDDRGAWGMGGTPEDDEKKAKFGFKAGQNWRTRPGKKSGDDHPVTCLAWADAQAFCAWLSRAEGKAYRLPTEAEWEYAARAGTTTRYWFGDAQDRTKANLGQANLGVVRVGGFPPNPFGLCETLGNVGEWVRDAPRDYTPAAATDPVGTGTDRVYRGGQWFCKEGSGVGRSSDRSNRYPADRPIIYAGFRVALDLGAPAPAPPAIPVTPPPAPAPPPLAVAPFTPEQARAHQEAWAKHLGMPVETAAELKGKDPGQTTKMTFRLIPPGEFLMGADPGDDLAAPAERPPHPVRLTRPFYLGVHEVTVQQFRRFADDQKYQTTAEVGDAGAWGIFGGDGDKKAGPKAGLNWRTRSGKKTGDDHPVTCLAWADAQAFCAWLSRVEGKAYRLPTEAEWEYACRAGTTTRYWFGDDQDVTKANLGQANSGVVRVGYFPPNPFGLHETHGNVSEWVRDAPRVYGLAAATDPVGTGADRVFRGGYWLSKEGAGVGRSADRKRQPPDRPFVHAGFRVALDLGAPAPPAAPVGGAEVAPPPQLKE